MNTIINNNKMKTASLSVSAVGILPAQAILKDVRISYKLDASGKKTSEIESIRYDLVDPETFSFFTVKVISNAPVITQEALNDSDTHVFVTLPVEETVITPYEIKFGEAKVTIQAPFIKLAKK